MNNEELLELYGLDHKLGTKNNTLKRCKKCGTNNDINEKTCKNCNTPLPKTKMLSCTKSTALGKRRIITHKDGTHILQYMHLLSKGLELYEMEALRYEIQENPIKVTISNEKMLRTRKDDAVFMSFIEESVPGLWKYAERAMAQQLNEYATRNFTSLAASTVENLLYIHLNYRALESYILPYKAYYFGNRVDVKEYFPDTDFNNEEEVNKIPLNKDLLSVWDLRNPKYIEKIIEISKMDKVTQEVLVDSIKSFQNKINENNRHYYLNDLTYNNLVDTYSLIFNSEISVSDFMRIYLNSRKEVFVYIYEYSKNYKKYYKKNIDWSSVDKITNKDIEIAKKKVNLLSQKFTRDEIETLYKNLSEDPMKAFDYYLEQIKNKEK